MDSACLGNAGLKVYRIRLGCMSYRISSRGTQPWTLDKNGARPHIKTGL